MDIRLVPGVCFVCDCTDEYGCDEGCSWVDGEETLCSACERRGLLFLEWMVAAAKPSPDAGGLRNARTERARKKNTP